MSNTKENQLQTIFELQNKVDELEILVEHLKEEKTNEVSELQSEIERKLAKISKLEEARKAYADKEKLNLKKIRELEMNLMLAVEVEKVKSANDSPMDNKKTPLPNSTVEEDNGDGNNEAAVEAKVITEKTLENEVADIPNTECIVKETEFLAPIDSASNNDKAESSPTPMKKHEVTLTSLPSVESVAPFLMEDGEVVEAMTLNDLKDNDNCLPDYESSVSNNPQQSVEAEGAVMDDDNCSVCSDLVMGPSAMLNTNTSDKSRTPSLHSNDIGLPIDHINSPAPKNAMASPTRKVAASSPTGNVAAVQNKSEASLTVTPTQLPPSDPPTASPAVEPKNNHPNGSLHDYDNIPSFVDKPGYTKVKHPNRPTNLESVQQRNLQKQQEEQYYNSSNRKDGGKRSASDMNYSPHSSDGGRERDRYSDRGRDESNYYKLEYHYRNARGNTYYEADDRLFERGGNRKHHSGVDRSTRGNGERGFRKTLQQSDAYESFLLDCEMDDDDYHSNMFKRKKSKKITLI